MSAVYPTVTVLLDDGTGTYPTDISSRVSLSQVSVQSHGRTDEFATAAAATLTVTLKNNDGALSTGIGFGVGGFGAGPFGGGGTLLFPGQGIRYKETLGATTVAAFTGKVSELPLAIIGGPARMSEITLTAVDPLAALALRPLRSMLEEEILLRSPSAYYTLGEAEGSTSAGDTSGSQGPPLAAAGAGTTVVFAADTGLPDGSTGVAFADGQYLAPSSSSTSVIASFGCAFRATVNPTGTLGATIISTDLINVSVTTGGMLLVSNGGFANVTGPVVTDGLPHVVMVTSTGSSDKAYLDGVLLGGMTSSAVSSRLTGIGGAPGANSFAFPDSFTGVVSHAFAVPTVLITGGAAAINNAAVGASESTAARFARIASYAGATTSTPVNSGVLVAAQATSGTTALDALQSVAAAEGGVMFANGSGTLVLQGHGYRAQKTTPTLTVPMKDVGVSTTLTWDTQQVVNQVSATRTGGAGQTVASAASISTYGLYAQSLDLPLLNDSDVLSAAQWLVNKHSTPTQRIGTATVNLLTSSIAAQLMQAEVGDRWSLSGLPAQAWSGFGDLSVEGWSRNLVITESSAEWSMTVNLLPWSLFQSGIYDDAGSTYDNAVYA